MLLLAVCAMSCASPSVYSDTGNLPEYDVSGDAILALEKEFVEEFPHRHSGQPNNLRAAQYLEQRLNDAGLTCEIQEWEVVNYGRPTDMNNTVCTLDGRSDEEVVLVSHHDQAPMTEFGADNDGSGVAVMVHLAELMAKGPTPKRAVVFLFSDGEEYGMLGARHYLEAHTDRTKIVAAISLDNVGKELYRGMLLHPISQFKGIAPLWLSIAAKDAAVNRGESKPVMYGPIDIALAQSVPVSFTDQGPFIAAGIPAIGISGYVPNKGKAEHWATYHTTGDVTAIQDPETLEEAGRIAESLLGYLAEASSVQTGTGPFLLLDKKGTHISGVLLYAIFFSVAFAYFVGSLRLGSRFRGGVTGHKGAILHFAFVWASVSLGFLSLRLMVDVGIIEEYALYPATSKDQALSNPDYLVIALFLALSILAFFGVRNLWRRLGRESTVEFPQTKSVALSVVGVAALYIIYINPFSLLFLLPIAAWTLIRGRKGLARIWDIILFLAGGAYLWAVVWYFGWEILHTKLAILWYLILMFSTPMVSIPTTLMITAVLAAGLSMLIRPPGPLKRI